MDVGKMTTIIKRIIVIPQKLLANSKVKINS